MIDVLFEQLKFTLFNQEFEMTAENKQKFGIYMNLEIELNNLEAVISAVGFPEDNTTKCKSISNRDGSEIKLPSYYFCRDYLICQFDEIVLNFVNSEKLNLDTNKDIIKGKITEYINWLYKEFRDYDNKNPNLN